MIIEDIYSFHLGEWKCLIINDGVREISLSDFFRKDDITALSTVLEYFKIDPSSVKLSINILTLKNAFHTIVIDPGLGKDVGSGEGRFLERLIRAGIDPDEVDHVVITHGHWDHIGGITGKEGLLNFPNAKYVMPRIEWEYWTSKENQTKMPEIYRKWVERSLPSIKDRVTLISDDEIIIPGIKAISAPGHTPGQICLLIESKKNQLLYLSDILHFHFQTAMPEISSTADMNPVTASQTRNQILQDIFEKNLLMQGFHLEFPGLGKLKKSREFCWEFMKID